MPTARRKTKRPAVQPTVGEAAMWCDALVDYLRTQCFLADNTVRAYRRDLQRFLLWLGKRRPQELSVHDLADYVAWLGEQQLAPASVARHLVSLKMFYRYLQLEGQVRDNPVELLGSPKLWQRIPQVLSPRQLRELLEAPRPGEPLWRRDRAMLELLYATGCRASEISHLCLDDVHFDTGFCRCVGKGEKQRIVPLGDRAASAIRNYLDHERPALAALGNRPPWLLLSRRGRRLRRERIWELFKKYAARTSAPEKVSPHTMRHTFATHMLAGGADLRQVQEMLGHANIATTQIYTHVDPRRLKRVHQQFHPRG